MSELIRKSKCNLDAAHLLISSAKLFSPSVHCSYYSCVQLMVFILINEFGISESHIETQARNASTGTHKFAIDKIYSELFRSQDDEKRIEALKFQRIINSLKEKRILSDYKEFAVNVDFANNSLKESKEARNLLLELYKINEDEWN